MRSIIEFALFAWVAISVLAVVVQLIRIARYKRANDAAPSPQTQPAAVDAKPTTIDLDERLKAAQPPTTPAEEPAASQVMAGGATAERLAGPTTPPPGPAPTTPTAPAVNVAKAPGPPPAPLEPAANMPMAPPAAAPAAVPEAQAPPVVPASDPAAATEAPAPAPAEPEAPTLADLLAGVRLPWNLLPAVDQSREPSNDRVVLITSEGEPSAIGVDVADELERLGFTVAPRGDDTAVATRDGHSLGLQIIEEPMKAEVDGTRRFPTATESSVALDIWVEVNVNASA